MDQKACSMFCICMSHGVAYSSTESVVEGGAMVSSIVNDEQEDVTRTKFWHTRLGHMEESVADS